MRRVVCFPELKLCRERVYNGTSPGPNDIPGLAEKALQALLGEESEMGPIQEPHFGITEFSI